MSTLKKRDILLISNHYIKSQVCVKYVLEKLCMTCKIYTKLKFQSVY